MYKHLVLWKLKETDKEANIKEVVKQVQSLKESIPEILELQVGENIGSYGAKFFDVGMYITFKNEEDFFKYISYETHDKVVAFIQSVTIDEQIVDFI